MPAAAGSRFGPYEVVRPIGAGGMGEVFEARDTRLDRVVALKISREQFSDRFAQEARATAALNHPHIATLYDVGPDYLVMEFVAGETLRGPIPAPRALSYARQILDALEAAHRKGIVHRDLKPDNILVAKNGVKLLDFGLARMKPNAIAAEQTATMALTMEGTIAGTLHYMSPEQLQGKPADARSDIFSFGLVLYEMLTGLRAFEADNPASLISQVLTADPRPLHELTPLAPAALERVLTQCIAKDPDERWQSAADVRRALDLAESLPGQKVVAAQRSRSWLPAAAFALGVLTGAGALWLARPKPAEPWTFRPLTYFGRAYKPSLSPDGKQVAFLWNGEKGNDFNLYVELVSGGNPLRLPDAHPSGKVAWSPDGSRLAFQRGDGLYVMPSLGGAPHRIATLANGAGSDVSWSPDGSTLVFDDAHSHLYTVGADGGEPKKLTNATGPIDHSPAIAPDGRSVAFVRRTSTYNSQVMAIPLKGGEPQQITTGVWDIGGLDWTADGKEVLFEGSSGSGMPSLWRVPRSGGKAVRFNTPSVISGEPAVARTSGRAVYVSGQFETKIFTMPLHAHGAGDPKPIVEAIGDHRDLSVAPDGSKIAFTSNRTGSKEVWVANRDGSGQTQLTSFNGPSVGSPRWSPDGKWIAFDGYASGSSDIYVVAADGGKPSRITSDAGNEIRPSWSHDGQWVYFGWTRPGKNVEIWKVRPSGKDLAQVTRNGGYEAFESADGKWLYVDYDGKLSRMRPDGSEQTTVAQGGVIPNFWVLGGKGVYVVDPEKNELWRAEAGGGNFEKIYRFAEGAGPVGGGTCLAVSGDESYAIYRGVTRTVTNLMLVEQAFPPKLF